MAQCNVFSCFETIFFGNANKQRKEKSNEKKHVYYVALCILNHNISKQIVWPNTSASIDNNNNSNNYHRWFIKVNHVPATLASSLTDNTTQDNQTDRRTPWVLVILLCNFIQCICLVLFLDWFRYWFELWYYLLTVITINWTISAKHCFSDKCPSMHTMFMTSCLTAGMFYFFHCNAITQILP